MSDDFPVTRPGECWWFEGLAPTTAHPVAAVVPALTHWIKSPAWLELDGPPGSGRRWLAMALLGRLALEHPGLPMACIDLARGDDQLRRFSLASQLGLITGMDPAEVHRRGALAFSMAGAGPGAFDGVQALLPSQLAGWWIVVVSDEKVVLAEELARKRGSSFSTRRLEAIDRNKSGRYSRRAMLGESDHRSHEPRGDVDGATTEAPPPRPPPPAPHTRELLEAVEAISSLDDAGDDEGAWQRFLPLAIPLHVTLQQLTDGTLPQDGLSAGELMRLATCARPFLSRAGIHALARTAMAGCVEIARATGDSRAEIECLIELGAAQLAGGDPFGSRAPLVAALERARALSLADAERAALAGSAERAQSTGDLASAVADLEAALELTGDEPSTSRLLRCLGDARLRQGEHAAAGAAYQQSLLEARECEAGEAQLAIGLLAIEQKRDEDALVELDRAIERFRRRPGATAGAARSLGARAIALQSLGRHREALASLQAALQLHRRQGDGVGEMLDLHHLSETLEQMGESTLSLAAQVLSGRIARAVGGMVSARVIERLETMRGGHGEDAFAPWVELREREHVETLEEGLSRLV